MTLPESKIDVAVIGAGIIGVCIALELAERGLNAVSYTHLTLPTILLV